MINSTRIDDLTLLQLLDAIAAKSPTPGGGAIAPITAALAAALAQMVINYSVGKKSLSTHAQAHTAALKTLAETMDRVLQLADEDARAYGQLNQLMKLDPADARRIAEFPRAVEAAVDAPRSVVHTGLQMLDLINSLLGKTNALLNSDLAISAILADAAVRGAAWNVHINLPQVNDPKQRELLSDEMADAIERSAAAAREIERRCR